MITLTFPLIVGLLLSDLFGPGEDSGDGAGFGFGTGQQGRRSLLPRWMALRRAAGDPMDERVPGAQDSIPIFGGIRERGTAPTLDDGLPRYGSDATTSAIDIYGGRVYRRNVAPLGGVPTLAAPAARAISEASASGVPEVGPLTKEQAANPRAATSQQLRYQLEHPPEERHGWGKFGETMLALLAPRVEDYLQQRRYGNWQNRVGALETELELEPGTPEAPKQRTVNVGGKNVVQEWQGDKGWVTQEGVSPEQKERQPERPMSLFNTKTQKLEEVTPSEYQAHPDFYGPPATAPKTERTTGSDFQKAYEKFLKDRGELDTSANELSFRRQWEAAGRKPEEPKAAKTLSPDAKASIEARKDSALQRLEGQFSRGLISADELNIGKQRVQDAYEQQLRAGGASVTHFSYGPGGPTGQRRNPFR